MPGGRAGLVVAVATDDPWPQVWDTRLMRGERLQRGEFGLESIYDRLGVRDKPGVG